MSVEMVFRKGEDTHDVAEEIDRIVQDMLLKRFESVDGTLRSKIKVRIDIKWHF